MSSSKCCNVMESSCNKLFSREYLASGSGCFFIKVIWVLGIVNSPPTEVWVVCLDETGICDVPMLVVELYSGPMVS